MLGLNNVMNFKEYINEVNSSRIRRILWGNVPTIDSIGILTASNPGGNPPIPDGSKQQNATENNRLCKQLEDDLRMANYGPIQVKGKFGQWEKSYMVPNIKRNEAVALGKKYGQYAVIWGKKHTDPNGNPFFKFEWIEGDQTTQTRDLHVGNEDVQNRDDFFTLLKNRKITIPFFDDPYSKHTLSKQYGHIDEPVATQSQQLRKAEFFIPFFDDAGAVVKLMENNREPSYYKEMLKEDEYAMEIVAEIKRHEENLKQEGKAEKYYWLERGNLQLAMQKLADYLN